MLGNCESISCASSLGSWPGSHAYISIGISVGAVRVLCCGEGTTYVHRAVLAFA